MVKQRAWRNGRALLLAGVFAGVVFAALWHSAISGASCFRVSQSDKPVCGQKISDTEFRSHVDLAAEIEDFVKTLIKSDNSDAVACSAVQVSSYAKAAFDEGQDKIVNELQSKWVRDVDEDSAFAKWAASLPAKATGYLAALQADVHRGAGKIKVGLGAEHTALDAATSQARGFEVGDCSGDEIGAITTANDLAERELTTGLTEVGKAVYAKGH